jgi:hypothetical protein
MNRRTLGVLGLTGAAAVAAVLALKPATTDARPSAPNGAPTPDAARLPVNRVVLFSAGIGHFLREGEVDGDARVDLSFQASDINDLIKSLTLQDLGGGLVTAVAYDSHDPVERTLKSFAVDLTGNPSQAQLLDQARGEKAEIVLQQSAGQAAGTLTGAIVGVEHQQQVAKEGLTNVAFLNMWCADGLRSVKLADVQRVRFLNPVLESEYRRALDTISMSRDSQKKAVSLSFSGQGKRKVRVGYVTEAPIWKASYRLALPPLGGNGTPYLQGWAIVENPSDEDWHGVKMSLVSGRPISFKMDMYSPLYVPRPTVEPELFASLRPQTYEGDMARARTEGLADRRMSEAKAAAFTPPPPAAPGGGGGFGGRGGRGGGRGGFGAPAGAPAGADMLGRAAGVARLADEHEALEAAKEFNLASGVASAATGERLGESFQYLIEQPVNLPRQKSALLPIVQKDVEASRVSVYNPAVHNKFPLLGLKLKNTTGLNLMQGPITVFEGATYAGDARVMDLQPNEERLMTYAIDLGTEVEAKVENPPSRITKVTVQKGILYSTTKQREERKYHVVNRSQNDRTLLVEHPYRPEFHLATDLKPSERTRNLYRFEVKVPAGKTGDLDVAEERDLVQTVQLTNSNEQQIRIFLQQQVLSPAVRQALEKAVGMRGELANTQRDLQQVQRQLTQIEQDQTRLRANLKEMPPTAEAYKRYLAKFDQQESEIEKLQAQRQKLQDQELQQRTAYDAYLMALNVE